MKKQGELTTQQIVILIIVIVSFAILLYFFVILNPWKETDDELCHNSVIMRSQALISKSSVPLNCKTSYVCISEDGSCEAMTNPEIKEVKSKLEIFEVLADEMANCWWMFGEGKVNYVSDELVPDLYCSICSQIAFDDSIRNIDGIENEISKEELYNYLVNEKIKGKEITYSKYFYGVDDLEELKRYSEQVSGVPVVFGKINTNEQYYSVMGIMSDISTWGWVGILGGGTALVAGGIAAAPFTGGASAIISAGLLWGAIGGGGGALAGAFLVAPIIKGESGNNYLPPTLIESNSAMFEKLNCSSINTLA